MKKLEMSRLLGIVANVGVIAGLVFVALQIRQNTLQLRAESSYSINQSVALLNQAVFQDDEFAALLVRGEHSFRDLSATEKARLTAYYFSEINLADYIIKLEDAGLTSLHFDYVEYKIDEFNSVPGRREFVDEVLKVDTGEYFGSQTLFQRLIGQ